jgi:adenine-specific DNA methylase
VNQLKKCPGQTSFLTIADSRDLFWLPEKSVDLVLTDPPYYDNLAYSEMADFYFVWLKTHVNWANTGSRQHNPMSDSLLVRDENEEEHSRYTEGLSRAFEGCRKAIKDEGIMIFTYHHSNQKAWESVTVALRAADFQVTNCFPVLAEGKSGFHSDRGNLKWDIVYVCRPGRSEKNPKFSTKNAKRWISARILKWGNESDGNSNLKFRDIDQRSLIFGLISSYLTRCRMSDDKIHEAFEHFAEEFSMKPNGTIQKLPVD